MLEDEGHAFLKLDNVLRAESRRVDFLAEAFGQRAGGPSV
jgi:hypothetical protein